MKRQTALMILAPLAVLLAGAAAAGVLIGMRAAPPRRAPEVLPPLVRTVELHAGPVRLEVHTQGTVIPRTESTLTAEVAGRIVSVSPRFADGAFFEQGEVLLEIDPADYREALAAARVRVAEAELRLAQEEAAADVARREWRELGEQGGSPLALRELQVAQARAALDAARAAVERAERDLARTRVVAPYAGRVRQKLVDLGQFVARGVALARVYAIDRAEVHLPVAGRELAWFDAPLAYRGGAVRTAGPRVRLTATLAGRTHRWDGRITRTIGEIDPQSRVITVVAEVRDPYGRRGSDDRPPLAVGTFVEAAIEGHALERAFVVPREAFFDDDTVLVVDAENRVRFRDVHVVKENRDDVIVSAGLEDGERVLVSPLETVTEGMLVRVVHEPASAEEGR
ncbi:MAG: efflux RND transporter periplasmic adaptor subunit [Acidobacteria bacterium]|nr:MAG: efflux RND transporter periplasmic adaptor subunit [Acidobacteriota bacterium]